jgi:leader peptidase (prepilin peptidase)/N-methyltransferase
MRTSWVELAFVFISLWLWVRQPSEIDFVIGLVLFTYFGLVIVIDVEHKLIMHPVSVAGGVIGFIVGVYLHGLSATLIGGLVGFLIMFLLYYLGQLVMCWISMRRGYDLEEEALGFGDVNLGGVIGLILGWPGIIIGLILAVLLAGFFSLLYMLIKLLTKKYKPDLAIPYGPFLSISTLLLIFFRDVILRFI